MNQFFKLAISAGLSAFAISCQSFSDKNGANFSPLPWPDMIGVPPDKSVKNWVKFDLIGTTNHPFPFVWFSSQEFKREYPNVLINLDQGEYEQFKNFVRSNQCTTKLEEVSGDPLLRVTEYADDHDAVRCIMSPAKACEYVTKIFELPKITLTEEQIYEIRLMTGEFRCRLIKENQKIHFEFFDK